MATNLREHICGRKCYGPFVELNKRKKQWILGLKHRVKEGKLEPKVYFAKYPINFCPFCGEDLYKESRPHLESCDCVLCTSDKLDHQEIKITENTN